MAKGPRYAVQFRRKREGRTNYAKRLKMLRAKLPRLIVRKSNKYITVQISEFDPKGDKTLITVHSSELKKENWKYGRKNTPAAYLTGIIAAKKAKEKKIENAIFDMGAYAPTKGAKLFAALKGAVDGGLKISFDSKVMPAEKRIEGLHIAEFLKKPELSRDFAQIKQKLLGS